MFLFQSEHFILDGGATIEPRNGGCEPRVECVAVPMGDVARDNIVPFPQCVEVHRCGGCCHEAQLPCLPVQQVNVTFSPVNMKI